MATFTEQLKEIIKGKVCIFGVGNRMQGDDGAGSWLVERIAGHINADCIDGGSAAENFVEKVVELAPETVLVVDAADFHGMAGDARIFEPQDVTGGCFSTHAMPLQLVCDYVSQRTSAGVYIIAIQPVSTEMSDYMSETMEGSVELLAEQLLECLPRV